jgi:FkbM family methyltransferase
MPPGPWQTRAVPRYPYGTQKVLDGLQRKLDEIEKTWPMTGSYERIDPYIIPLTQANEWFELIIYHIESKLWFDKSWTDFGVGEVQRRGMIKPGSVAFDLGCNSGAITVTMAMQAGPGGHVHAFDPYPWNAAATQASATLNRLDNVTTYPVGVSNKTHFIHVAPNDSRTYEASSGRTAQKLDIRHIREFMHLKPSHLKIDIEGAEHDIFDIDDPHLYDCVQTGMLELHPMWIQPRGIDCRTTLRNIEKCGFQLHFYTPDTPPYDVEGFSENHHLFWLLKK